MAFSKQLEDLIEAALADGVITDKERSVLHKKALLEGVDPDEVDMILQGRLAKTRVTPSTEKRGNIVKCPNCGAPVKAGATRCDGCGYEFSNVKAVHSSSVFFEAIQKEMASKEERETRNEKINMMINSFPVPTTKEDILEFLYMGIPNSKKKGNFISLYPAISGVIIGIVIILMGSFGFVNEHSIEVEGGVFRAYAGGVFMLAIVAWWLPLVCGGIMYMMMNSKSKELHDANQRANAWRSKTEQVLAKARISLAGDPDLGKVEVFAKQIGL